jgi:ABC-type transport system substrate-binding protein
MQNIYMIGLNTERFPFDNALVRQAVVRAIDYDAVNQLARGQALRYNLPLPIGVAGRNATVPLYERDLEKAKALLAEAGYPNGKGIPELRMIFLTDVALSPRLAEVVQSNLADIGIKVKLEGMTESAQAALWGGIKSGKDPRYPDMMFDAYGWYPDGFAWVDWIVATAGLGNGDGAWYIRPQIEEWLEKANRAATQEERFEYYSKIQWMTYEDAPYIPLLQWKNSYLQGTPVVSDNVQGFIPNCGDWEFNWSTVYFVEVPK